MQNLRITAGAYRGRNIKAPDGTLTHPMGSREKMALFNSLVSLIKDKKASESSFDGPLAGVEAVLDLFCGSGALGLEALSRGAKKAVFVDNSAAALQSVKSNISLLNVSDRTEVIKADIKNLASTSVAWQKYDLILVDPPYDNYPDSLENLEDLLEKDGILVLSHPASVNPASILPRLELISTKTYAAANLSFFRQK